MRAAAVEENDDAHHNHSDSSGGDGGGGPWLSVIRGEEPGTVKLRRAKKQRYTRGGVGKIHFCLQKTAGSCPQAHRSNRDFVGWGYLNDD